MLSEAWGKAATVANATSGFEKARINPFQESDPDDEEFLGADVTNMVLDEREIHSSTSSELM